MIYLYDRSARLCSFDESGWQELLAIARTCGWQSRGTVAPLQFDLKTIDPARTPWDGNYDRVKGQIVTPTDANALSRAIERALAFEVEWKFNDAERVKLFASFSGRGGFVISDTLFDPPQLDDATLTTEPTSARESPAFAAPASLEEDSSTRDFESCEK